LYFEFKQSKLTDDPANFIKIARPCPNLQVLALADWFHESRNLAVLSIYTSIAQEILQVRQALSVHFQILAEENAREPLLPHIQEMRFINHSSPRHIVQGMSQEVYNSLIKRIWRNVLFYGNGYKSL